MWEGSKYLGEASNNRAEYEGLILGLEAAHKKSVEELAVYGDSELVTRQMRGEYQVKANHLRPLWQQARDLCKRFKRVEFHHVGRERNAAADALANEAMDRRR
jgi:ribonuclease HI